MKFELPECGNPATVHIEAYSSRETLHGSLDASVYVCADHSAAALKAISAAGLTPHTRYNPPSAPRPCGYVFDYTRLGGG